MVSVLAEEKNKYLITVTNKEILDLKVKNINFLFPVQDYSVGYKLCFKIKEIKAPNAFLFINRILDCNSIAKLKEELKELPKNIVGICFTDLGVFQILKELKIEVKLIYMQNHNTTNAISINYYLEYVDSVLISTDITKEEIMAILNQAKKPLVIPYFMLVDCMYSRRTLLSNFAEEFHMPKKQEEILQEPISNNEFKAVENEWGTVLYAKKFIDYRNLQHENILYYYINPIDLTKEEVEKIIKQEDVLHKSDTGFLSKKTYYRLKEDVK